MGLSVSGVTGTITGGTISGGGGDTICDGSLDRQAVNRMLGAGADVAQAFQQQILRANADDQALAMSARRSFELNTNLLSSALDVLQQRALGGQPQSGGGPGQPVSFPVQQQLPAPMVYSINPTTGAITKA